MGLMAHSAQMDQKARRHPCRPCLPPAPKVHLARTGRKVLWGPSVLEPYSLGHLVLKVHSDLTGRRGLLPLSRQYHLRRLSRRFRPTVPVAR